MDRTPGQSQRDAPKRSALQKFAVLWVVIFPVFLLLLNILCFTNPLTASLWLLYLVYINGPGLKASSSSKGWEGWRRFRIYKHFASYFPLRAHKTADLDPDGRYIFVFHPHGPFHPLGVFGHFDTDLTEFSSLFPGIRVSALTLMINFRVPFIRELMLFHRVRDASKKSCLKLLSKSGSGIMLAVGGAQESELCEPHTMDLVLKKRKGFVKLALQAGASMVPVIGFGENEIWDIIHLKPGTFTYRLNRFLRGTLGFALPRFIGVGWNGGWGFLPKPVEINTVFGKPIAVPKFEGGTTTPEFSKLVDKYHLQYIQELQQLYDDHKDKFAPDRLSDLRLIE